jgi:hypothetical protein
MNRFSTTLAALLLVGGSAAAAPSLNIMIDENDESAAHITPGEVLTLTLTIKHTGLSNPFSLPKTPGLPVTGSGSDPRHGEYTFFVTPARAGDFTIPAFDIRTDSGQVLHVNALKLHVWAH